MPRAAKSPHQASKIAKHELFRLAAFVRDVAAYFVLGTALFAEMLIAPVVINYAHKLHRAGREIIAALHDEQKVHRGIIDDLNLKIDTIITRIGQAQSDIDKHASALAEMTAAALHLYRETAADLKAEERRLKREFFTNRARGDSQ